MFSNFFHYYVCRKGFLGYNFPFYTFLWNFGPFWAILGYFWLILGTYWNDFSMHYFLFNDFYLSAWRHKHSFWCVFQQVEHPKWPILVFWGVLEGPKLPDQHFDQKNTWNMFIWSIRTLMQKIPDGAFFFFWTLKIELFSAWIPDRRDKAGTIVWSEKSKVPIFRPLIKIDPRH